MEIVSRKKIVEAVAQHRCNNDQDFLSTIRDVFTIFRSEQMSDF